MKNPGKRGARGRVPQELRGKRASQAREGPTCQGVAPGDDFHRVRDGGDVVGQRGVGWNVKWVRLLQNGVQIVDEQHGYAHVIAPSEQDMIARRAESPASLKG